MSLLEGSWKCAKCGYILSSEQYINAKFENCPRCGTHLSNYNRIVNKVVLDDLPIRDIPIEQQLNQGFIRHTKKF
jgi:DNA-directed RNA polymerase subunit RPC12/RpoP